MMRGVEKRGDGSVFGSWISDILEKIKEWLTVPTLAPVPVPATKPGSAPESSRKTR